MSRIVIGVDIGGTKCALTLAREAQERPIILEKIKFSTEKKSPQAVLERFLRELEPMLERAGLSYCDVSAMGISCGGPLDSKNGVILSPPNLPGWDKVRVCEFFEKHTGIKARLQNDANACALAEWRYGAGKGTDNMVFCTFGTGLGAGLILNGRLYSGATDNAGEIGHVRLTSGGPVGYGKAGSCEGYCSGGGLAQLGARKMLALGKNSALYAACDGDPQRVTAKLLGELAEAGDKDCIALYRQCGRMLGRTLAVLCDVLDVELIVLGGIYLRSEKLLRKSMEQVLKREALFPCPVRPSALGEKIGDYSALCVALTEEN